MSAQQPDAFDPKKAARLDDPKREEWFPTLAVLSLLAAARDAAILDYGTGTARYAIATARALPEATVVAFDSQDAMLEIARDRIHTSALSNLRLVGPDSTVVPTAYFDNVLALNVLHELDDRSLAHIRGTLKPTGSVLFIDWNAAIAREMGPPADHSYTFEQAHRRLLSLGYAADLVESADFPYHFVLRARAART